MLFRSKNQDTTTMTLFGTQKCHPLNNTKQCRMSCRRDEPEVKDVFASIDRLRVEFESVQRPVLQIEIKEKEERSRRLGSLSFKSTPGHSRTESPIAAQLRTRLPSESDSEPGKLDQDYKEYDMGGWEFDEDLASADS